MIDQQTVERIIDSARIVDVVGEFVTLKKSGVNYKGLCPFHDDRNPSFVVSPSKNICHCFVCGKGGSPARFLMDHEQITYAEALKWLARKYNIEVVEREQTDEERRAQSERESMYVVNEWAKDFFHQALSQSPDGIAIGKQYFRSRAIRDDIIEKFQLGYALQERTTLATAAIAKGFQPAFLVKTGLCIQREKDNSLIDRYAGRVIFPWINVSGKVVAFGGRLLDARTKGVSQKYVNSPDSEIFHKERELYGIYQAKKAIVKEDRVFMVEGYTDVIAMHQAGIENVVANSGTALSEKQIYLLRRFTNNITLLYDGDEAGIHAAMRGTDMLLADGMNVKVLLLPDGDDPDSFSRKYSADELRNYIEQHQVDFITFLTTQTVMGVSDPVKRSEAIGRVVRSISVVPDQILRSTYLTDFAHRINMKEQTLISEMNKYIRQNIEARQKERERAERTDFNAQDAAPLPPPPADLPPEIPVDVPLPMSPQPPMSAEPLMQPGQPAPAGQPMDAAVRQVELMLVREIVRHGEQVIYQDVETDDGQTITLNVAQYIDFDLSQDGLQMASPLHTQMLAEAVARSADPAFKAESYFCAHPDAAVSTLATQLAVDRYPVEGRFALTQTEESLRQRVIHLVMDYRLGIIESRLKDIQRELLQLGSANRDRMMELLKEHKDTKEIRDALAKRLGSSLFV